MATQEISRIIPLVPDLKGDDPQFLTGILERFPRTLQGFRDFTALPPMRRVLNAAAVLEHQPRSGWLRFGIEPGASSVLDDHFGERYGPGRILTSFKPRTAETVLRHSAEGCELFGAVYIREPHVQLGAEVMKFHDFVEAIDGDFTPKDKISRDEKDRLERIALGLLTEARKSGSLLDLHIFNCQQIFDGLVTDFAPMREEMLAAISARPEHRVKPFVRFASALYSRPLPDLPLLRKQAKDIDLLQMAVQGLTIIQNHHYTLPHTDAIKEMDGFWDYIRAKLTTPEARRHFEAFTAFYRTATGRADDAR